MLTQDELKILWVLSDGEWVSTNDLALHLELKSDGFASIDSLRKSGFILIGTNGRWSITKTGMKAFEGQFEAGKRP